MFGIFSAAWQTIELEGTAIAVYGRLSSFQDEVDAVTNQYSLSTILAINGSPCNPHVCVVGVDLVASCDISCVVM